jgi:hypothetical protein
MAKPGDHGILCHPDVVVHTSRITYPVVGMDGLQHDPADIVVTITAADKPGALHILTMHYYTIPSDILVAQVMSHMTSGGQSYSYKVTPLRN